jgi:hypothetical protein
MMNITAKDIESEIERTQRRISFMVLSDHDRERAEAYLIELYVQRDILRRDAKARRANVMVAAFHLHKARRSVVLYIVQKNAARLPIPLKTK